MRFADLKPQMRLHHGAYYPSEPAGWLTVTKVTADQWEAVYDQPVIGVGSVYTYLPEQAEFFRPLPL